MKKIFLSFIIAFFLFSSCRKTDIEPGNIDTTSVTAAQARDTLYYIMKQWYYWYDKMPSVTKENYADPYELLEAVRYKELDKWSFVADYDEFNAEMEGSFIGHGFRIGLDDDTVARIAMIYKNSRLYFEGVRRGWIVKKINNVEVAPLLLNDLTAYNNLLGPRKKGIWNTFLFQKPDGSEVTIKAKKTSFSINSVLLYETLNLSSGVTGHLVFESFIEPSEQELETAFAYFKSCNVKDLILDLRYNSGGYLYIAQQLASYIGGNGLAGTTFAALSYNDKMQAANRVFPFISTSYSLSLPRIVVITSRMTASASEAVMNGLDPPLNHNIISIGDTTYGKPVGMNGWTCGKKYFFWPITFKLVNSSNEGDYFDGFTPDKIATDDITHDFSDTNEECLKEAILYLETGSFSGKGVKKFRRHAQVSEKPSWMNNTFVLEK
ncbi:MAG: S41 family peptidase [Bacteroidia bacterium]|nr:S41 family peptidase [Bacteroidia bacterium]